MKIRKAELKRAVQTLNLVWGGSYRAVNTLWSAQVSRGAQPGTAVLEATDLGSCLRVTVVADDVEDAPYLVDHKALRLLVSGACRKDDTVAVAPGRVEGTDGVVVPYDVLPVSDFPTLPTETDGVLFRGSAAYVSWCMDVAECAEPDEKRPTLHGVWVEYSKHGDTLRCTATDGATLARRGVGPVLDNGGSCILDLATAEVMRKALSRWCGKGDNTVTLHTAGDGRMAALRAQGLEVFGRTVEDPYVDVQAVWPKGEPETEVRVSAELVTAARSILAHTMKPYNRVMLTVGADGVTLEAFTRAEGERPRVVVPCKTAGDGQWGFDGVLLERVLRMAGTNSEMQFRHPLGAVEVLGDGAFLLMPCKQ